MDAAVRAGARAEELRPWVVWAWLAGVVALAGSVAALLLGGGAPARVPAGLPDPGVLTAWGSRLVRLAVDAAAVLTTGSLLTAALLIPAASRGAGIDADARRAVTAAARLAAAWAAGSALLAALTAAELVGAPLSTLTLDDVRQTVGTGTVAPRLVAAVLAGVVAVAASSTTSRSRAQWLTAAALAAVVAPAVTGHAASGPDHEVATAGLVVHVLAATVWIGGVAGLVVFLRRSPRALAVAAGRFSVLALGAFVAVAGSGAIAATARLGTSAGGWTSAYGWLVLVKVGVLLVLGGLGHLHRRHTLPLLGAGTPGPFRRLVGVELVVMAAAAGLAAALARTPLPALQATPGHGSGHPSLPASVSPVSTVELLTAWRPNAVVVLVVALAGAAYLSGVRRVARRGQPWSRSRAVAFLAGLGAAVLLLCSGVATYAPALVSVHLAQFLGLLLVVPALLASGSPLALWLAVHEREAPRAVRPVADPLAGATLVCALVLGTFRTPLVELSLRHPWLHVLLLGVALLAGTVFLTPYLGHREAALVERPLECALGAVGVAACLGVLAYQLRYGDQLLAGWWFLDLGWRWADPAADQRLGGAVAAGAALTTLLLWPVAALTSRARR